MNEKLQELTKKIYDEGLEKGKAEAREIIEKAKKEAEDIVAKAQNDAHHIIEKAEKEAEEQRKNVHSELVIASKQAVATVKQKVTDLLTQKAVEQALAGTFDDKDFVKNLIIRLVEQWKDISKSNESLMVFLPEKDREQMESYLMKNVAQNIRQGMEITFDEGIKSGFRIGPKDQSYKISFTEKDFELFFKQFLRPRTQKFFTEQ
ncbi:MAG TPA: V-type ATP synthase subunit E family protein [Bacteroidales bacterium]|nr:V-type ATP synthase subunit E family protein [Bacteroidales bacterium]HRW97342.1 V-type ATP synthase subunit E family protein [Bacteroidales bacterium]